MKLLIFFALTLVTSTSFAKEEQDSNKRAGINYKETSRLLSPQQLAASLTASYHTDIDKVRSIFSWIANNISYYVRPRHTPPNNTINNDDANDTSALKPLNERVAEGVLIKRMAFCDGYARLFKTLCDYAGITSELITGHAKTSNKKKADQTFRSNHRWNAVMIDSTWHLLDVTWASGYLSYSNDFVRHFDDRYFMSPAEIFIRDHYPEDVQWTLLPSPPTFKDYLNASLLP